MSLQVWLPLTKDLRQQGLLNSTATVTGTTTFAAGKLGQALNCNGSSFWTIPNVTLGSSASIACWCKTTVSGKMPWVLESDANNKLNFYWSSIYTLNTGDSNNNPFRTDSGSNINILNDGEWHHFVITFDGSVSKLYIDGTYAGKAKTFRDPTSTNQKIKLAGGYNNGHSYDWNGMVNDFRVYDHCLSPMEVKQLSQGLVLHYPLDRQGFGQENLLKESQIEKTGASNSAQWFRWNTVPTTLTANQTYTLSFDAKMSVATDVFYISWSNGDSTQEVWNQGTQVTTEYKRYSFTGATTKTNINAILMSNYKGYNRGNNNNTTGILSVKNIKLELDDKATPWCPASTDTIYTTMGFNSTTEYDCSGFCNNGTRTGTFTWTSDTPKYAVSTYMPKAAKITHPRPVFGGIDQEWTCAMWVKLDTTNQSGQAMNNFNYNNNIVHSANGVPLLYLNAGTNDYYNYGNKAVIASEWTHITFVFKNSNVTKLIYINGIEQTNKNGPNKTSTPAGIPDIVTVGTNLAGYISDYRIYATALSAEDVKSLYQNSAYIDSSGNIYGAVHTEV